MAAYEQHSVMGTTCSLDPAIHRYERTVTARVTKYSIRGHLHARSVKRTAREFSGRRSRNAPIEAVIVVKDSQRAVE
jgi:hypothetical protein